ncbi:hypothetical protein Tco_0818356 [Tanacetum coccineum]
MESLHLSFQRVVDNGMFNGIKLSSSLSISHLFYADDAVFMGQWCDGNISTLIHVLECFYRASGLRINMSKSKILGVNVDSDKVKGAASKLGCLIIKTSFTYLGSKVGGSMSRVHAWNENGTGTGELGRFFVASVRKIIDDKSLSDVDSKTRWIKCAEKMKCFIVGKCCSQINSLVGCSLMLGGRSLMTEWYNGCEPEAFSMHKQMFEGIDVMRRLVEALNLNVTCTSESESDAQMSESE